MDEGMEKYSRAKELYSRAKELYYRGHLIPDDIREIDRLLTEAIDINPRLFGPHLYKGKLRLDLAKFYYFGEKNNLARKMCVEAEEEIKKALRKGLKEEYGKYHLSEITRLKEERTFPTNLEEVKKMTKNTLLLNHALIEWFENTIREIIIDTLERNERYIGHSVAAHIVHSVGAGYRLRSVYTHGDCLEEEKNLQPIYFLEFYDYGNIIDKNKEIFQDLLGNPERWANALRKELARIRNAIRHSRGGYLSDRSLSNLMAWCEKLQEINEARRRWVRK